MPGHIRDAILSFLSERAEDASLSEIHSAVSDQLGDVAASSVRSYLNLNTPRFFVRTAVGRYACRKEERTVESAATPHVEKKASRLGQSTLYVDDCFSWLSSREPNSIHALVTDPPYGLKEYNLEEQKKLRSGKGVIFKLLAEGVEFEVIEFGLI